MSEQQAVDALYYLTAFVGYFGFAFGLIAAIYLEEIVEAEFRTWFPLAASSLAFAMIAGEMTVAYPEHQLLLRAVGLACFLVVQLLAVKWALEEAGDTVELPTWLPGR
ncbi:hypothetical protein [Natronococcus roseus]|uniref:hypothetical protein n=1 Tax=Natronococcus roseus TaxID=1052014 RepID=UPI00374DB65A